MCRHATTVPAGHERCTARLGRSRWLVPAHQSGSDRRQSLRVRHGPGLDLPADVLAGVIDPARRPGPSARSGTTDIPPASIARLNRRFKGSLIRPADEAYGALRRVWNGMIDRYPALIARCTDTDDVVAAMAFGTELGLPMAVRGGGHSVAGPGT